MRAFFPSLGKAQARFFQALEILTQIFPSPGKFPADFSKAWK
jgi:hypothetical protein